jgi:hypothetical protein
METIITKFPLTTPPITGGVVGKDPKFNERGTTRDVKSITNKSITNKDHERTRFVNYSRYYN